MPIEQVKLAFVPKGQRGGKVNDSIEWKEIATLVPKLPLDEALIITLSKDTVAEFKNKDLKIALAAFRQKLISEYKDQGFKISVIGEQLIVKHRTEKPENKKPKTK
jgi:hypothetical protein